jgi:hypothetical protein
VRKTYGHGGVRTGGCRHEGDDEQEKGQVDTSVRLVGLLCWLIWDAPGWAAHSEVRIG